MQRATGLLEETVQERHALSSTDEDKAGAVAILKEGAADAGLGKYPILRRSFLLANGTLGLMIVPLLFSLGRFQDVQVEAAPGAGPAYAGCPCVPAQSLG